MRRYRSHVTWALWLGAPIGATALAAIWSWWRGWRLRRAARPLGTEASVRAHSAFLSALAEQTRPAAGRGARPAATAPPDTLDR